MTEHRGAPASGGVAARRDITQLHVTWERDDQRDPDWLEALPEFPDWTPWRPVFAEDTGSPSGYSLDVQATYESLLRSCGDTPEVARRKVAALIRHVNAWQGDEWFYVSCTVEALSGDDGDEAWATAVEAQASSSSVRSFHADEAREELADEVRAELEGKGWTFSDPEWEALPREELREEYWESGYAPGADAAPLAELPPASDGVAYRYASLADGGPEEGDVLAVCRRCGAVLAPGEVEAPGAHAAGCARFRAEGDGTDEE